ncbi:MAG: serine hydrolase, partial [Desulfobacterales bacterium]|nr:serine hydrolase [Desulfobacterales bacterium]
MELKSAIERSLKDYLKYPDVGCAVGLVTPDGEGGVASDIFYYGAFRDQFTEAKMTPNIDTLWSIGSISKALTGALFVLKLAENPKKWLSETAYDYIEPFLPGDDPPDALKEIKLHQLALMNAGLPGVLWTPTPVPADGESVENMFASLMDPAIYKGEYGFDYSSICHSLLAFALLKAYGREGDYSDNPMDNVAALYEKELFAPLGMDSATIYRPPESDLYNFPYGVDVEPSGGDSYTMRYTRGDWWAWPAYIGAAGFVM